MSPGEGYWELSDGDDEVVVEGNGSEGEGEGDGASRRERGGSVESE